MSISPSVGALSKYLNKILINPTYNKIHKDLEGLIKRVPWYGFRAYRAAKKLEESVKGLLIPGMLFEELGLRYIGPIDGNNLEELIATIDSALRLDGPILIHTLTKKGKGYALAEKHPEKFHKAYPDRFFDVGMAEQHAVTFAAGLAKGELMPIVAIYSTFMQRSYDQIVHDVCLQNLHVVLCLDRAGIVGEDGPTHHGLFDIPYLRHMPNITIMAPKDQSELKAMLKFAVDGCKEIGRAS